MGQQTVFVREYYHKDTYFNPVTLKIRPNILKKAYARTPPSQNQQIKQILAAKTATRSNQDTFEGKQNSTWTASPLNSENPAKYEPPKYQLQPVDDFSHIVESQRTFIMECNKELQRELKDRESRLSVLGRKCEQLQMQLVAVSGNSLDHSSNLSQMYNFSKSMQTSLISEHSNSHLQKLKSIRDRLQKIDFSRFISANSVVRRGQKNQ